MEKQQLILESVILFLPRGWGAGHSHRCWRAPGTSPQQLPRCAAGRSDSQTMGDVQKVSGVRLVAGWVSWHQHPGCTRSPAEQEQGCALGLCPPSTSRVGGVPRAAAAHPGWGRLALGRSAVGPPRAWTPWEPSPGARSGHRQGVPTVHPAPPSATRVVCSDLAPHRAPPAPCAPRGCSLLSRG